MTQLSLDDIIAEYNGRPRRRRRPGSDTSRAAAEAIADHTPLLREQILDAIRERGSEGATCDELEAQLHMRHQTCSARVNQLRNAGKIVDSGKRRKTRSNRLAAVWVTP